MVIEIHQIVSVGRDSLLIILMSTVAIFIIDLDFQTVQQIRKKPGSTYENSESADLISAKNTAHGDY